MTATIEYTPHELPLTRNDLMKIYSSLSKKSENQIDYSELYQLDPKICAIIRDKKCFNKSPFPSLLNSEVEKPISIGDGILKWVQIDSSEQNILDAIGLTNFKLKEPCDKRIAYIEKNVGLLSAEFLEEIKFIVNFTSTLLWVEPHHNQSIGSAAFYEVPHCSFFSDMALFSAPPENIIPKKHSGFAIIENLYHEALHHQIHVFSIKTDGYLTNSGLPIPTIKLSWRDRDFSLLEAFHALHVYASITPMRLKYLNKISNQTQPKDYELIFSCVKDGLRMWADLSNVLSNYSNKFKSPYSDLIDLWRKKYNDFSSLDIFGGVNNAYL